MNHPQPDDPHGSAHPGNHRTARRAATNRPPTPRTRSHQPPSSTRPNPRHGRATQTQLRGSSPATPATVWACGPLPLDPAAAWPTPLLTKIVTSLTEPGGHVVLLPWPTPTPDRTTSPVDTGAATTAAPDTEITTALNAITRLHRTVRVAHLDTDPNTAGPPSRPFWADLIDGATSTPEPAPPTEGTTAPQADQSGLNGADVVITSLRPEHSGNGTSDHVALLAAHLLRAGGILAVITHSDWTGGELVDPTGAVVASAQNADLLYLQHIVALHTPIRDGALAPRPDDPAAAQDWPVRHGTRARNWPAPHRRVASDLLLFAQARDHQPSPPAPVPTPPTTEVIR